MENKLMKFKVTWTSSEYGHVIINAKNADEAREMFEMGDYEEKDVTIKNGGRDCDNVGFIGEEPQEFECKHKDKHGNACYNCEMNDEVNCGGSEEI